MYTHTHIHMQMQKVDPFGSWPQTLCLPSSCPWILLLRSRWHLDTRALEAQPHPSSWNWAPRHPHVRMVGSSSNQLSACSLCSSPSWIPWSPSCLAQTHTQAHTETHAKESPLTGPAQWPGQYLPPRIYGLYSNRLRPPGPSCRQLRSLGIFNIWPRLVPASVGGCQTAELTHPLVQLYIH